MPKKRRKLSPELEQAIEDAKRKVELITAMINDIEEEDIQGDYLQAFEPIKLCITHLSDLYKSYGVNEESLATIDLYKKLILRFESEYEV